VRLRANGIEESAPELRPAVPEDMPHELERHKMGQPEVVPTSDGRLSISVPHPNLAAWRADTRYPPGT
jgi:hypothetical protein